MKKRYLFIPPCPRCGSKETGRYIYALTQSDYEKLIAAEMKRGRLSRVIVGFRDPSTPNLYCDKCGAEWFGNISYKWLAKEDFEKEKGERDINEDKIESLYRAKKRSKKTMREKKISKVTDPIKNFFRPKKRHHAYENAKETERNILNSNEDFEDAENA